MTDHRDTLNRIAGMMEATDISADDLAAFLAGSTGPDGADDGDDQSASTPTPTVRDYVASIAGAYSGATGRTYRTYHRVLAEGIRLPASWKAERIAEYLADAHDLDAEKGLGLAVPSSPDDLAVCGARAVVVPGLGDRKLDAVRQTEVGQLAKWVLLNTAATDAGVDRRRHAAGKPPRGRDGHGAQRHFIEAVRSLYTLAAGDNVVSPGVSPAAGIAKLKKGVSEPKTMSDSQLDDVWHTTATTGDDPDLDALMVRLHFHTGARQEGALNLRLRHLDFDRQTVTLDQKNDKTTELPVCVELLEDLLAFAVARGSSQPDDHVLRLKGVTHRTVRGVRQPVHNAPVSRKRYNTLSDRVRGQHAWAEQAQWQPYWLRHHAGSEIEQIGGLAVKRRFLGHEPASVTDRYGVASLAHVAWAVAVRTGQPHPLAQKPPWL